MSEIQPKLRKLNDDSFVNELMSYPHNLRVLIYRYMCKEVIFTKDGWLFEEIKPDVNDLQQVCLNEKHQSWFIEWEMKITTISTFGLTIVLLGFYEYYPINMYSVFVATYYRVKEISLIELLLSQITTRSIKLPKDLIISRKYGLKTNRHLFQGKKLISMDELNLIIMTMKVSDDPILFIDVLKPFDWILVNAIYLFTSITNESRIVLESSEIYANRLSYTLPILMPSTQYDGDWWFQIISTKMFASFNDKITINSYISRLTMNKLEKSFPNMIVVGFISKGSIFPILIDSPPYSGNWELTNKTIADAGYNVLLKSNNCFRPTNNVGFVKNNSTNLYKLI